MLLTERGRLTAADEVQLRALEQRRRQLADRIAWFEAIARELTLLHRGEIAFPGGRLRAIHTPGHESGHCCYYEPERRWLFTGDTILSTGTTIIAPPDGDMTAYLDSLRRLRALDLDVILPAHGPPIERPYEVIDEYLSHRLMREQGVLDAVVDGITEIPPIVARLYVDLHPVLHWAAALTVQAHLEKLERDGRVRSDAGRWLPAG